MSNACKPRFKGIENFLRRIAFNLGNTPSQTEVKIISCIPIDVTDLQNKIIDLEKELDERVAQNSGGRGGRDPVCNTALVGNQRLPADGKRMTCKITPCPSALDSSEDSSNDNPGQSGTANGTGGTSGANGNGCGFMDKVKKISKKKCKYKPAKAQMVYYAQTTSRSPFRQHSPLRQSVEESVSRRREYERAERAAERVCEWANEPSERAAAWGERGEGPSSLSSRISAPVCRDTPPPAPPLPDDLCSCCHGLVRNLDLGRAPAYADASPRHHSAYYDSSLYDLVPVKERPAKKRNDGVASPMREEKGISTYYKGRTLTGPPVPPRAGLYKLNCRRKTTPMKPTLKRERVIRAMQKRKLERLASVNTVQNSVECGRVYMRYRARPRVPLAPAASPARSPARGPPRSPARGPPRTPARAAPPSPPNPARQELRHAECLTVNLNDTECQTTTSRSVQLEPPRAADDNKTEATLDQIKSILHAVLTEVKTNTLLKCVTKDATVQKGRSQSNILGQASGPSRYESFAAPPPPLPAGVSGSMAGAASGALSGGVPSLLPGGMPSLLAPGLPALAADKYLQNYPLFIHTLGRQCACCSRAAGERAPPAHTATNTDSVARCYRNKETEKLIKEIYKSITTDHAIKNTSGSDLLRSSDEINRRRHRLKLESEARAKMVMETLTRSEKREPAPLPFARGRGVSGDTSATTVCRLQFDAGSDTSERARTLPTSREPSPSHLTRASSRAPSHRSSREPTRPSRSSSGEQYRAVSRSHSRDRSREQLRPHSRGHSRLHSRAHSRAHSRTRSRPHSRSRPRPHSRVHSPPDDSPGRGARGEARDARHKELSHSEEETDSDATVVNAENVEEQKKKKKGLLRNVIGKLFSAGRSRRVERGERAERAGRRRADSLSVSSGAAPGDGSDSDDYETIASQYSVSERGRRRRSPRSQEPPAPRRAPRRLARYCSPYAPKHKRSPYMEQEHRRHWGESVSPEPAVARRRRRPYFQSYETRPALTHDTPPRARRSPRSPDDDDDQPRRNDNDKFQKKQMPNPSQGHPIPKKGFHLNITRSATQGLKWLKKRKSAAKR